MDGCADWGMCGLGDVRIGECADWGMCGLKKSLTGSCNKDKDTEPPLFLCETPSTDIEF